MLADFRLLLFSGSLRELGWPDFAVGSDEVHELVERIPDAALADLADHFSSEASMNVLLCADAKFLQETNPQLSPSMIVRDRVSSSLIADVSDVVREIYSAKSAAPLVVFFGRNPLYPLHILQKGVDLLFQDDDVVVIGQGQDGRGNIRPMWVATKSYHPEFFEAEEVWSEKSETFLQLTSNTQSLVVPMRPVRDVRSFRDLPLLFHDIEREILLGRWHPHRTYEALKRIQRLGILSEAAE